MDVRSLQNLAYTPPDTGFPDRVKEAVDNKVYSGISKVWRGMLQVASSGFGKGLLLTAAIVLGVAALVTGSMAYAGMIDIGNGVLATFDTGVKIGINNAIGFLKSGFGLATLGIGGALGAVADVRKHQNKMSAEAAQAEARQLEIARALQQAPDVTTQQQPAPAVEPKFRQPTNGKAAASLASAVTKPWEAEECGTFCQQEKLRRARSEIVGKAL